MGWFGSNAADKASPYLEQIPGVAHEYMDPYVQQGQAASQQLPSHYDRLMNDPKGYLEEILQGYKPSSGYNYKAKNLMQSAQNSAAAGGFSGTNTDTQQQQELLNSLMGTDMQQYIENIMGIHNQGLTGTQGIADTGYKASSDLSDTLGNNLQTQGSLAYQGQAQKNSNMSALINSLIGGASYAAGGLPGAAAAQGGIQLFGGGNNSAGSQGLGGYDMGSAGGFPGMKRY